MKKGRLMLLAGLAAFMMTVGAWAPMAGQVDSQDTVVAFEDEQVNTIPTILPPL